MEEQQKTVKAHKLVVNNRKTSMVHQPTLPTKVPSAATKIISCTGTVKIYQKLLQHLLFLYNAPP